MLGKELEPTLAAAVEYGESAPESADFSLERKLKMAPRDKLKVPLPIIPSEDFLKKDWRNDGSSNHHLHFLSGTAKFSPGIDRALRTRIVRAEKTVHNGHKGAFHPRYEYSPTPSSLETKVSLAILYFADYLPTQGVDLWHDEPVVREFERWERDILETIHPAEPDKYKYLYVDRHSLSEFLIDQVIACGTAVIDPELEEAFNCTAKLSQMRELGNQALRQIAEVVASPIKDDYSEAWHSGQLHPKAPAEGAAVVMKALGNAAKRQGVLHSLKNKNRDLMALRVAA